jgi:hypothetical protein
MFLEEEEGNFRWMTRYRMCAGGLGGGNAARYCNCFTCRQYIDDYPLHWLAEGGDLEQTINQINTEILSGRYDMNALLNARDVHGFTPLLLAAMHGHLTVVMLLHQLGASLEIYADMSLDHWPRGCNALHLAAFNDRDTVCFYLVSRGGMNPEDMTQQNGLNALQAYGVCTGYLSNEEKQERVHVLVEARQTYVRNANWARRYPLLQTLLCGGLRWTAAQRAAHASMSLESRMQSARSVPSVPRDVLAQIFRDCPGLLELIVSFL